MSTYTTTRTIAYIVTVSTLLALSGCSRAATDDIAARNKAQDPTARIIGTLADFKTFRMTSAQIDTLVSADCKRTSLKVVDESTLSKYDCSDASGIRQIKIDSHESGPKNYLWYAIVFFDAKKFGAIRSNVQKRLGRPNKSDKTYSSWQYSADKQLNARGNPSIMLMLSDDGEDGIFQIALDQGP